MREIPLEPKAFSIGGWMCLICCILHALTVCHYAQQLVNIDVRLFPHALGISGCLTGVRLSDWGQAVGHT